MTARAHTIPPRRLRRRLWWPRVLGVVIYLATLAVAAWYGGFLN